MQENKMPQDVLRMFLIWKDVYCGVRMLRMLELRRSHPGDREGQISSPNQDCSDEQNKWSERMYLQEDAVQEEIL